jgi:hypothetical protein
MPDQLPRCPEPGCPFRWLHGRDRPCAEHADRRDHPDQKYAELINLAPGDHP